MPYELSNQNCINLYLHCGKCLKEVPEGTSPREYQRIQVGWTDRGLQVWCVRHDCNVVHIDFEGQTHPANTTVYVGKASDEYRGRKRRS